MSNNAIEIDIKGMAKIAAARGVIPLLLDLIANAWDTKTTAVSVTITPLSGRPMVEVVVEDDDPDGFQDLAHAYTLFADSHKKWNEEQRGRFNVGEKQVIAYCIGFGGEAEITTTKGAFLFTPDGKRKSLRARRAKGSRVRCVMRMTRAELLLAEAKLQTLIPPVPTTVNGELIEMLDSVGSIRPTLPTLRADDEGVMRPGRRGTDVHIYPVREGERAHLYEMGIPVVETEDEWHYDVRQKVPLNIDRDNVTPGYLQALRTFVFNEMHQAVKDHTQGWVSAATSDERCSSQATKSMVEGRFGKGAVTFDASDPEANMKAMEAGRQVIHGGNLSADQWRNVRGAGTAVPSGKSEFKSPEIYNEDGEPEDVLDPADYTDGMRAVAEFCETVGTELIGRTVRVVVARHPFGTPWAANYGGGRLCFNLKSLGHAFFKEAFDGGFGQSRFEQLFIHELAHHYGSSHYSKEFYDGCCKVGAALASHHRRSAG